MTTYDPEDQAERRLMGFSTGDDRNLARFCLRVTSQGAGGHGIAAPKADIAP